MTVDIENDLDQRLRGRVIDRLHPEYDEARRLYNGMIDKRPLLIAQCLDAADVVASVGYAREERLPVAIRGGGHNGPGLASVDDGLVIDLSRMRGVRVDIEHGTVRVAAGAPRVTSTMRPTRTGSLCPSASSRRRASRD